MTPSSSAEGSIKYTLEKRGSSFRFQWQPGEQAIPQSEEDTYSYGIGTSLTYEWDSRLSFGAAFNYAPVGFVSEELRELGIEGDAQALLIGAMYKLEPFYFAVSYVDHRNHDTDDELRYIDGRGFEIYLRYALKPKWRVVGGINYLDSRRPSEESHYNIRLGLLSVQYSLRDASFRDSVYVEYLLDESFRADGTGYPNAIVFGVRLGFEI